MLNMKKNILLLLVAFLPLQVTATSNPAIVPIISYLLSDSTTTPSGGTNTAPTANAGSDKSVVVGHSITLSGSGSDSDGTIASYEWKKNSVTFSNERVLNYVPQQVGVDTFILIVTDNDGETANDSVDIHVTSSGNQAPIARAGNDVTIVQGENVTLDGSASSDDNGIVKRRWLKNGAVQNFSAQITPNPKLIVGTYTFTFWVQDGHKLEDTDDLIVTVEESPNAPNIVLSATNVTKEEGMAVYINANQSSDNETPIQNLSWQWKEGTEVLSTGTTLNHIFALGLHTVVFRLTDTDGLSSYANITINIVPANSACNSQITDDTGFVDNPPVDKAWSVSSTGFSTKDIENAFNLARASDPTITKPLVMPAQWQWDSMKDKAKALYILNHERHDRGIKPFSGYNSTLSHVAFTYANTLYSAGRLDHTAGDSIAQRMAVSNVITNGHEESFGYKEALKAFGEDGAYEFHPIARAIYEWIYQDASSNHTNRNLMLKTGYNDNSGVANVEGIIGIDSVSATQYGYSNYNGKHSTIVVMNIIDEKSTWDNARELMKISLCPYAPAVMPLSPRYTIDNSYDATAIDRINGLVWQNPSIDTIGHASRGSATATCNSLDYDDSTDWRLPTGKELAVFHRYMNAQGAEPAKSFERCIGEVASDFYVKNQKGADTYGGRAGDIYGDGTNLVYSGAADFRCVRN